MISAREARQIVLGQCQRLPSECISVASAIGRVLADDVLSDTDLPPFDNAAMDGFAIRCAGSVPGPGTEYAVGGEQAAGDKMARAEATSAWAIMTGASMPGGLDTVIPIEQVEVLCTLADGSPARIRLATTVRPGQHVRRAGEDVARGVRAAARATPVGFAHLMLFAGLGLDRVAVVKRPQVALLCTGRELVDEPSAALRAGQIRNSNAPFLSARLVAGGAELVRSETVSDDGEAFRHALDRALEAGAGVVISTGAVSMGRYDFVPSVLHSLGAEILFHKVAMRPGKPLLFARLATGQLYFGLPGNPVSSAVGLRFFIEPALRRQLGLLDERPWRARLTSGCKKPGGPRLHQKARLDVAPDGLLQVSLLQGQESFKTLPLLHANAWAVLPEDTEELPMGAIVDVYPLGHESGICLGAPTQ